MPKQYRPITIPSNILRLITVRMASKMSSIVERNGLIGQHQFGFRSKRSTLDAVMCLSTMMKKGKAKRWPFAISFLDISKVSMSSTFDNIEDFTNITYCGQGVFFVLIYFFLFGCYLFTYLYIYLFIY